MTECVHIAHKTVKSKRTHYLGQIALVEFDDRPDQAKRLEQARRAAGFESARAAAIRFDWSYDTYSQHERGERGLSRSAKRYAKAFKVSEAWLLTGETHSQPAVRDALIDDLLSLNPAHRAAVAALVQSLKKAESDEVP